MASRGDDGTSAGFARLMAVRAAVGAVAGVVVALGMLAIDAAFGSPLVVPVGNAHALLVALVGAVLTIAVFTLWMRTVMVGITAGAVSPRIASTYLDDDFQRRVTAWMVGAFAYLMTLVLRFPSSDEADPAPLLSTVVAGLIAVAALVAVLVAMRHAVATLSPPVVVRQLADQAFDRLDQPRWPDDPPPSTPVDDTSLTPVRSRSLGWVREIDHEAVLDQLPAGGVAVLYVEAGDFIATGDPLAAVDTDDEDHHDAIRAAVTLGRTRRTEHDVGYAIAQLVDVVQHATAPASQDTSTAVEALVHLRAVLAELILRGTATGCLEGEEGRRLVSHGVHTPLDHLRDVAERLRTTVSGDPVVDATILSTFELLERTASEADDEPSSGFLAEERQRLATATERMRSESGHRRE